MTAKNNLMKRVVYRDQIEHAKTGAVRSSFGLCSDPLTHFAVVFSAFIHDTDHTEVSKFPCSEQSRWNDESVQEEGHALTLT